MVWCSECASFSTMSMQLFFALNFFPGKGFHGRFLAKAWKVPLLSASKILRQSSISTDTGKLVDCETVSSALLRFLKKHHQSHFLMDGFPRTRQQIDLMNKEWPVEYRISTAFRLDVPDTVCAQKIAGRRLCRICHQEPNSANVVTEGFVLPPTRPTVCEDRCDPERDWDRRADDESDEVIAQRLRDYRQHEHPLVDYYECCGGLFSFTPYFGAKDVPKMQQALEDWLTTRHRI